MSPSEPKQITIVKANQSSIRALSKRLLELLDDKNSQVYRENAAKFGIPDEYVKKAFADETLLETTASGKSTIYVALHNRCEIAGFAQVNRVDNETRELDRIVVFPEFTRQRIGTRFLERIIRDERLKGTRVIIVNAGKDEAHARRFYEKNGFAFVKEVKVDAPWGAKMTLVTYQLRLEEPKRRTE